MATTKRRRRARPTGATRTTEESTEEQQAHEHDDSTISTPPSSKASNGHHDEESITTPTTPREEEVNHDSPLTPPPKQTTMMTTLPTPSLSTARRVSIALVPDQFMSPKARSNRKSLSVVQEEPQQQQQSTPLPANSARKRTAAAAALHRVSSSRVASGAPSTPQVQKSSSLSGMMLVEPQMLSPAAKLLRRRSLANTTTGSAASSGTFVSGGDDENAASLIPTDIHTPESSRMGRRPFTSQEDQVIVDVVQHEAQAGGSIPKHVWDICAGQLGNGRTAISCKKRFETHLNQTLNVPFFSNRRLGTPRSAPTPAAGTSARKLTGILKTPSSVTRSLLSTTRGAAKIAHTEPMEDEHVTSNEPSPILGVASPQHVVRQSPLFGSEDEEDEGFGGDEQRGFEEEETVRPETHFERESHAMRSAETSAQERATRAQHAIDENIVPPQDTANGGLLSVSLQPRIMTDKKKKPSRKLPLSDSEDEDLMRRHLRRQPRETKTARKRIVWDLNNGEEEEPQSEDEEVQTKKRRKVAETREPESEKVSEQRTRKEKQQAPKSVTPAVAEETEPSSTVQLTSAQLKTLNRIQKETKQNIAVILHALFVCSGRIENAIQYLSSSSDNIPVWTRDEDKVLLSKSKTKEINRLRTNLLTTKGGSECEHRVRFLTPSQ